MLVKFTEVKLPSKECNETGFFSAMSFTVEDMQHNEYLLPFNSAKFSYERFNDFRAMNVLALKYTEGGDLFEFAEKVFTGHIYEAQIKLNFNHEITAIFIPAFGRWYSFVESAYIEPNPVYTFFQNFIQKQSVA